MQRTLKNVFVFKYLGSLFAADGNQKQDIDRRINLGMVRMGQLRQVFNSKVKFARGVGIYVCA